MTALLMQALAKDLSSQLSSGDGDDEEELLRELVVVPGLMPHQKFSPSVIGTINEQEGSQSPELSTSTTQEVTRTMPHDGIPDQISILEQKLRQRDELIHVQQTRIRILEEQLPQNMHILFI